MLCMFYLMASFAVRIMHMNCWGVIIEAVGGGKEGLMLYLQYVHWHLFFRFELSAGIISSSGLSLVSIWVCCSLQIFFI